MANPEFTKALFGEDFHWGVTTSAYQIEGAWNVDGKGESIWDRFSNHEGHIKDKATGNIACDFYHRYHDDLKLLKNLNFKDFRFSLAWSRLLPEGSGKVNPKGIDFYNRVIDDCLALGIEPWVTLFHWDLPQALEDKGGWTSRDILGWFSEYAELCTRSFGDRVKHWMVLNEPTAFTTLGYLAGIHAPGHRGLNKFLAAVHHASMCQAEGGRIIRSNVPEAHIGTSFSCSLIEPHKAKPSHQKAAKRIDVMMNRLFIEPSLGMGYPVADLPFLKKLDKFMQPGDMEKLKFDFDFIGLQNYFRVEAKPGIIPFIWANRVKPDRGKVELTEMGWEVLPEGIYKIIKQFSRYPVKEIVISENGAAFNDVVAEGRVHDSQREHYFEQYLKQVLRAKNEGVNITGYFAWTFVDNFEWAEGFYPRFGIVYNDFESQQRLVKDSGFWFRDFLK
ncbi:MAG: GH1 family beta-glucosidase [Bacteroidota bacterium]|nr:GH1 family beta-glucosidase [Bacteroidota bacterium]